ncbi:MAG TPA: hypothetical protein VGL13_06420 [Polyangiaceae bacterium]
MFGRRGDTEADADLTIGDLARRAGVLPLDADRVEALLDEAGIVDDPGVDVLARCQRCDAISGRLATDVAITPRRVLGET